MPRLDPSSLAAPAPPPIPAPLAVRPRSTVLRKSDVVRPNRRRPTTSYKPAPPRRRRRRRRHRHRHRHRDQELEDLDTLTDQHADSKAYKAKVKSKPLLRGGAAKRARKASTDASSSATPSASSPSPAPRKGANGRTTRRSTAQAVLDAEDDNDKPSPSSSPGKRAGSKPEVCEIDESDSDDDLGPVDVVDDDPETQRLMKEAAERRRKREALQQQFANDLTPDDDAEAEVEEVGETRAPRVLQKRVRAEDVEEVMDSDDERGGGVGGGGGGASAAVVAGAIKLKLKLDGKEKDQQFAVKPENPLQKLLNAFCARNGYKPEDVKLMFDGEVLPYNQT